MLKELVAELAKRSRTMICLQGTDGLGNEKVRRRQVIVSGKGKGGRQAADYEVQRQMENLITSGELVDP